MPDDQNLKMVGKMLCTTLDELIEALQEVRDYTGTGSTYVEDSDGINQIAVKIMARDDTVIAIRVM